MRGVAAEPIAFYFLAFTSAKKESGTSALMMAVWIGRGSISIAVLCTFIGHQPMKGEHYSQNRKCFLLQEVYRSRLLSLSGSVCVSAHGS